MPRSVEALITPALLRWARTSAPLTADQLAGKMKTDAATLAAWEEGVSRPTVAQLRNIAAFVRRPLATFYLPRIPEGFTIAKDYRRLDVNAEFVDESSLLAKIREIEFKRETAVDLFSELREKPPEFPSALRLPAHPEEAAQLIREKLRIDPRHLPKGGTYEALNYWRQLVENLGALVFQFSRIPTAEARGFSISEYPLPAIALNSAEYPAARIFTLFHEFTHLLINKGGLCDLSERAPRAAQDQAVEVYCNHVSGALLVPEDMLRSQLDVFEFNRHSEQLDPIVQTLSDRFRVTREVVLRRMLIHGYIKPIVYEEKRAQFRKEFEDRRKEVKAGPHIKYEYTVLGQNGMAFSEIVLRSRRLKKIPLNLVSEYLNVKVRFITSIERIVANRRRGIQFIP